MKRIEKIFLITLSTNMILIIFSVTTIKTSFIRINSISEQLKEVLHYFDLLIIPLIVIMAIGIPFLLIRSSLMIKRLFMWLYYHKPLGYWKSKRRYLFWGSMFSMLFIIVYLFVLYRVRGDISAYITLLLNPIDDHLRVTRSLPGVFLLFGIPLLFISSYFIMENMIHSKLILIITVIMVTGFIGFLGISSLVDYWLYYINDPKMSIVPILVLPLGLWEEWDYSYVNLLFSAFLFLISLPLVFGSIQYQKQVQYVHTMRDLRTQEARLSNLSEYLRENPVITNISVEELLLITSISFKKLNKQIKNLRQKGSREWKIEKSGLNITPEMRTQLNKEVAKLRREISSNHRFSKLKDIVEDLRIKKLPIKVIQKELLLNTETEIFFVLNANINKAEELLSVVSTDYIRITQRSDELSSDHV